MKILLDHCTPRQVAQLLPGHQVLTAFRMGWADLDNGDLITAAEGGSFELFITSDRRIRYQQNLTGRKIAILVVSQDLQLLREHKAELLSVVNSIQPGAYREQNW
ncbi:MAG: hypothetical protein JWO95_3709 [Verrucomicrobiales bacterium]|nr:hypothetical protein [Verrucomicrobiales bacterium]